ncbi:MAG TPA: autotransporter-associated beta strand repeat-containing protein, partial [Planctomycetota bacterium]|nr:autotransporter-associated beta strand repeat-containing protein [Planctomycetota bacterium]
MTFSRKLNFIGMTLLALAGLWAASGSARAATTPFYWFGDHDNKWTTTGGPAGTNWSSSNGSNQDSGTIPSSTSDVFFVLFGAGPLSGGTLTTELGAAFSINSLNFTSDAVNPVVIQDTSGNNFLVTLAAGGLTNNSPALITINNGLVLGATQVWTNTTSNATILNGIISGAGTNNLTLQGGGAFTFNNANSYTGTTALVGSGTTLNLGTANGALATPSITLDGGTVLNLDNTVTNNTNRILDTTGLTSKGATIALKGGSATETVGTLTLTTGATRVNVDAGSTLTISNSLARSTGGTIDFSSTGTSIVTTQTNGFNGIIGGYATIGNIGSVQLDANGGTNVLDFAAVSGTQQIIPLATYAVNDFTATTNNTKLNTSATLTAGSTTTINSLYMTGAANLTLGTVGTTTTTLVVGSGGIISNQATITEGGSGPQINYPSFAELGSGVVSASGVAGGANTGTVTTGTNAALNNDLVVTTASNLRMDCIIANNGTTVVNLVKNGSGVLDLSDGNGTAVTNTYGGITTINGGLLTIKGDRAFGAVPGSNTANSITLNGGEIRMYATFTLSGARGVTVGPQGGTISYNGGSTTHFNPYQITGSGAMTFSCIPSFNIAGGTNKCALELGSPSAASNYQGPTTFFTQGSTNTGICAVIFFQNSNLVPDNSAVTVTNNDGKGVLNLFGQSDVWGSLAGNGNIYNGVTTTSNLTVGQNNLTTIYSGNLGTPGLSWTGVGNTSVPGGDDVTAPATTSSNITLTKVGTGTMTMSGVNGYTGATAVNGGALLIGTGTTQTGAGSLAVTPITVGTGVLGNFALLGGNGTVNGTVNISSTGHLSPDMTPTTTATFTINNNLTLTTGATLDFNFGAPGALDINNNPTGFGTGDVVKVTGAGTLTEPNGNANQSSAPLILNVTGISGFGLAAGATVGYYDLIDLSGSTAAFPTLSGTFLFQINGSTSFNYAVLRPGDVGYPSFASKSLVLQVTKGNPAFTWVGGDATHPTFWDFVTANWTSAGAGNLYADASNVTFDDTATSFTANAQLAVSPNSMVFSNGSFDYIVGGSPITVTGAAGVAKSQGKNATINANVNTPLTAIAAGTLTIGGGATYTSTTANLNGGTLAVNGTFTSPALTVKTGTNLNVANTGALGSTTGLSVIGTGTATFNNATQSVVTATGTGNIALTGTALTINSNSQFDGAISGTGSLTVGGGTLTLSNGGNSYGGGTTVTTGTTLQLTNTTGTATGTGLVLVNSGGTLAGTGIIGGALTVNGTLNPHANTTTAGLLTINSNTIINGGSILNFNFGASGTNDQLSVGGNATLNGSITINVNQLAGFGSGSFTLINATGTVTNNASFTFNGVGTLVANVSTGTGHQLIVTFAPPQLVWNGSTSSDWNIAANWTPARIPQNNDLVILTGSGFQPTNFNVNGLTLAGITFNNTTTTPITVTGTGGVTDVSLLSTPIATLSVNAAAAHVFNPNITMLSPVTASAVTGGSLNVAGVINGAATSSFTAAGPGTITLSNGANAYVGNTTVSGGTLSIASIADGGVLSPLGAASPAPGNLTLSGGTLQFTGATGSSNRGITLVGTASIIDIGANALTLNGQLAGTGSFTKNGSGTLTMTNPSSTYANTTENAGQIVATAGGALGTGNVTLNTAKLALNFTQGAGVTNFGGTGTGWTLNGGATVAADVATLTDGGGSEARSLFFNTPFSYVNGFTANFIYTPSPAGTGTADGVTFCLQNAPGGAAALGGSGGGLGYTGITNSAALEINIFTGAAGGVGIAYGTNGTINSNTAVTPVVLDSGDPIQFKVVYSPVTNNFVVTLTDATAVTTATITLANVNLGAALGSGSAFIGFTGGTGGSVSTQTIGSFSLTQGNTPAYPNSLVINGNSTVDLAVPSAGTAYAVGGFSMGSAATLTVTANGGAGNNIAYALAASGNGTLAGTDSINVASNGTSLGTLTLGGILSDGVPAGTLSATGPGVIALSGANTFTGGVNANAGLVRLANAAAGGTGTTIVNPAGTLHLDAGVTSPITLAGGTLENIANETITGGLTVTSPSTILPYDAFIGGTTQFDIIESGILHGSGNISVQTFATNNGPDGSGFRLRGAVSPDYTGTITIGPAAKFEIQIPGTTGSPAGTGTLVLTGGTISTAAAGTFTVTNLRNNGGGSTVLGNNVQMAGTGTALMNLLAGVTGDTITMGTLTIGSNQILAATATNTGLQQTLAFGATTLAGNATFQAGIPGNTNYTIADGIALGAVGESTVGSSLTANGKGTLTLTANNTYTGPTTIAGGTLQLGTGGTVGNISAAALSMAANTTLLINHSDSPTLGNAISLTGNTGGQANAGFINVVANSVTLSGGSIASAGEEFWKAGAGTLVVNESGNTYNVSNVVQAGVLQTDTLSNAGSASSLGIGGIFIAQSGTGTLRYSGVSATTDRLGAFALQGTGSSATIDIPNAATVLTVSSALGDLAIPATPNGFTKIGAGTLTLTGTNTYAGATVVSGGTLSVSSDANLGATATPAGVTLGVGTTLQSTGTFSTARVVTLNGNSTIDVSSGNTLTLSTAIPASTSALTKTSAGTLVLSGAQGYTGTTTVNGGTLRGQATVLGAIAINNNSTVFPGTAAAVTGPATYPDLGANQVLAGASISFSASSKLQVVITTDGTNLHSTQVNVTGPATVATGATLTFGIMTATYPTADVALLTSGGAPSITSPFVPGTPPLPLGMSVHYYSGGLPASLGGSGTDIGVPSAITPADTVVLHSTSGSVTPVKLEGFIASAQGAGTMLEWTAISEFQNLGFNLYRRAGSGELRVGSGEWQ